MNPYTEEVCKRAIKHFEAERAEKRRRLKDLNEIIKKWKLKLKEKRNENRRFTRN